MSSALRLRLQRIGCKNHPFYRIVCAPLAAKRDGKYHEVLGTYNPVPSPEGSKLVTLNFERTKYWLTRGAQPSTVIAKIMGYAGLTPMPPKLWRIDGRQAKADAVKAQEMLKKEEGKQAKA